MPPLSFWQGPEATLFELQPNNLDTWNDDLRSKASDMNSARLEDGGGISGIRVSRHSTLA